MDKLKVANRAVTIEYDEFSGVVEVVSLGGQTVKFIPPNHEDYSSLGGEPDEYFDHYSVLFPIAQRFNMTTCFSQVLSMFNNTVYIDADK